VAGVPKDKQIVGSAQSTHGRLFVLCQTCLPLLRRISWGHPDLPGSASRAEQVDADPKVAQTRNAWTAPLGLRELVTRAIVSWMDPRKMTEASCTL
jgi:hypothetical protein